MIQTRLLEDLARKIKQPKPGDQDLNSADGTVPFSRG